MPGFTRIDNDIFDEYGPKLGPHGIALFGLLTRYADANGESFPTLAKLCKVLDISRPTALKYLGILESLGLLEIETRRSEQGTQSSSLYRVKLFNSDARQSKADSHSRVNVVSTQSKASFENRVNDVYSNNTHEEQDPLTTQHGSNPTPVAPPVLPDGSFRLTDEQANALEALSMEVTGKGTLNGEGLHKYRVLFRDGLTIAGMQETVREIVAKRKERGQPKITSMNYFVPILADWMETEKGIRAESQGAQSDTGGAEPREKEIDLSLWGNPPCEWEIKDALEAEFQAGGDEERLRAIAQKCRRELEALNWPKPVIRQWLVKAAQAAEIRVRWAQGDRRHSGSCA